MREQHTVQELIDKLTKLVAEKPDVATATVILEGCDCEGDWNGKMSEEPYDGLVLHR